MTDKPDFESMVQLYADYVVAYGEACEAGLNYADSDDWETPCVEPYAQKDGKEFIDHHNEDDAAPVLAVRRKKALEQ
jgi:hypothetical protein